MAQERLPPLRGVWLCKTSDRRQLKKTRARIWVDTGRIVQPEEGCGKWNVYIGTKSRLRGSPKNIDALCKMCGRRIQMELSRRDNRGQRTPAYFLERPNHMPKKALIEEMLARNKTEGLRKEYGFTKASEWERN